MFTSEKHILKQLPHSIALFFASNVRIKIKTPSPLQTNLQYLFASKFLRTASLVVVISLTLHTVDVHLRLVTNQSKTTEIRTFSNIYIYIFFCYA